MLSRDVKEFLVNENGSLRSALEVIDRNGQGICFVVNASNVLVGVLTDGDVRRALLKGTTLDSLVSQSMQSKFTSLPVSADNQEIQAALSEKIFVIPLVDEGNHPVDIASFSGFRKIQVLEPSLKGNELAYVTDCISTGWISSQGAYVGRFEKGFAEFIGAPHSLAVSNGTVALHLALVALGVGPGDEVIVPDLTFAASANAVLHAGATPVLVDVDAETWTLDIEGFKRAITPKTKAVMPVHLYGHSCRMDEILEISRKSGIFVVEDCAESIGTLYRGKPVGGFGHVSCFSFFGNKTITTGEGGMILFQDQKIFERAAKLRDHGMSKQQRYWHDEVGYNYRLTNLQAAVGVAQMERVEQFVQAKRKIAKTYNESFAKLPGVVLPPDAEWNTNSYWLYTLLLKPESGFTPKELQEKLLLKGIETRPFFYPLHQMPPYKKAFKEGTQFPVSVQIAREGLCLPSSSMLSKESVTAICNAIHSLFETRRTITRA